MASTRLDAGANGRFSSAPPTARVFEAEYDESVDPTSPPLVTTVSPLPARALDPDGDRALCTRRSRPLARIARAAGRSMLPLLALAVLGTTVLAGPWVALVVAYGLWRAAGRFA